MYVWVSDINFFSENKKQNIPHCLSVSTVLVSNKIKNKIYHTAWVSAQFWDPKQNIPHCQHSSVISIFSLLLQYFSWISELCWQCGIFCFGSQNCADTQTVLYILFFIQQYVDRHVAQLRHIITSLLFLLNAACLVEKLQIVIMCLSWATCLSTYCCFSELAQ
jgi:hypothetical protein